jgi:DNA-binding MarR family transcriptional regulator
MLSKDRPELGRTEMRIRRLVAASGVPVATTLRWLARLESSGLLERRPDPSHERRVLVSLTPKGAEAMEAHFTKAEPTAASL